MYAEIAQIRERFEARIGGKRGAPEKRRRFQAVADRALAQRGTNAPAMPVPPHAYRDAQRRRKAYGLAVRAGVAFDERATAPGDYLRTESLDYVPPSESHRAPYYDHGGGGLGLVRVTRRRVYARSCRWRPSEASTVFLVGRNETGTFFAHAVPGEVRSVRAAVAWIWRGLELQIVARQGDIALVAAPGPKLPTLPEGHTVAGDWITHAQHAPLRLPAKGERIIVGRRATVRASEETRD